MAFDDVLHINYEKLNIMSAKRISIISLEANYFLILRISLLLLLT